MTLRELKEQVDHLMATQSPHLTIANLERLRVRDTGDWRYIEATGATDLSLAETAHYIDNLRDQVQRRLEEHRLTVRKPVDALPTGTP